MTQPDRASAVPLRPYLIIGAVALLALTFAAVCGWGPQPAPAPAPIVTPISTVVVTPTVRPVGPTPVAPGTPEAATATPTAVLPVAGSGGLLVSGWECGLPASAPCPPDVSPMPCGMR